MADSTVLLASAYDFVKVTDSTANADVTSTQAAPDADKQHIVQEIVVSFTATPVAAVEVQLLEDPAGSPSELFAFRLAVGATETVHIRLKGIKVGKGKAVGLKVPALGAGIISSATIMGMTRFAG